MRSLMNFTQSQRRIIKFGYLQEEQMLTVPEGIQAILDANNKNDGRQVQREFRRNLLRLFYEI